MLVMSTVQVINQWMNCWMTHPPVRKVWMFRWQFSVPAHEYWSLSVIINVFQSQQRHKCFLTTVVVFLSLLIFQSDTLNSPLPCHCQVTGCLAELYFDELTAFYTDMFYFILFIPSLHGLPNEIIVINKSVVMAAVLLQALMGFLWFSVSRASCWCQSRRTVHEMEMIFLLFPIYSTVNVFWKMDSELHGLA